MRYTREYNGSTIVVRQPTNHEIGMGYYDGNEWVFTVKNSRSFVEGSSFDKALSIRCAKMAANA